MESRFHVPAQHAVETEVVMLEDSSDEEVSDFQASVKGDGGGKCDGDMDVDGGDDVRMIERQFEGTNEGELELEFEDFGDEEVVDGGGEGVDKVVDEEVNKEVEGDIEVNVEKDVDEDIDISERLEELDEPLGDDEIAMDETATQAPAGDPPVLDENTTPKANDPTTASGSSENAPEEEKEPETLAQKKEKATHIMYRHLDKKFKISINNLKLFIEDSTLSTKENEKEKTKALTLIEACAQLGQIWCWKYEKTALPSKKKVYHGPYPKTSGEFRERLAGKEEDKHPWMPTPSTPSKLPNNGLLMRVTDESSKAKIYPDVGFLSGGSTPKIDTFLNRKLALQKHLSWRNRTPTVFISTSGDVIDFCQDRIRRCLRRDAKKPDRCTTILTFVNANARLANGWPVLSVVEEVEHYKPEMSASANIFKHEFLLPYRVGMEEIVGTYCWGEVEKYRNEKGCDYYQWHRDVVEPAFEKHERARKEGRKVGEKAGCVCCGH